MKLSCVSVFIRSLCLFTLLLAVALPGVAQAMDADELIAKSIEATGGLEKLQSIQSVKATGKFMAQGMEFPFTMIQKRPNFMRIEAEVMGSKMIQCFDGESGWSINPMTGSSDPQPMGEIENKNMKLQSDMDGMLVDYEAKGFTVEYIGEEDVEGTPTYQLRIDTGLDIVMDFYFDQEYFLAIKTNSKIKIDEAEMESQTYMSDFQEVNGVVMPFSIENRRGDAVMNQLVMELVEHDIEVDDSIFVMPEPEPKVEPAE